VTTHLHRVFLAQCVSLKLVRGPADSMVQRHLGRCRRFFAATVDKGLVRKNPFIHRRIKFAVRGNPDRRQFIPRA
jgi:hypothetical protein